MDVKKNYSIIATFVYDGNGNLVKKIKPDGSKTLHVGGVYEINVAVTQDGGGSGKPEKPFQYLVVYDNSASSGYVTGSGKFNSTPGAYALNPSLTGIARFDFVSQYQQGAGLPTGDTQFRIQAAGFTFQSVSYEWLVVAGAQAKFKGEGTVNGTGNYEFQLSATDGAVNSGGGMDKFRIKIIDKITGDVIYDNQPGAADTANPTTVIDAGSIIIHR